jgi:hypothetical protein
MLREWELPELIVVGASFGARPDEVPAEAAEDARAIARLVGFARVGASVLFEQDPGGLVAFAAGVQQRFGLSSDDAQALIDALEAEIREESSSLSLDLPRGLVRARAGRGAGARSKC